MRVALFTFCVAGGFYYLRLAAARFRDPLYEDAHNRLLQFFGTKADAAGYIRLMLGDLAFANAHHVILAFVKILQRSYSRKLELPSAFFILPHSKQPRRVALLSVAIKFHEKNWDKKLVMLITVILPASYMWYIALVREDYSDPLQFLHFSSDFERNTLLACTLSVPVFYAIGILMVYISGKMLKQAIEYIELRWTAARSGDWLKDMEP